MWTVLWFGLGLLALVVGAEGFVRGASRLASALRISPLIIGLTVVAFGTSAPELAVSIRACYSGTGALALGNVVGSNIFNILLILGLSALITPLVVAQQLVRLDVPLVIVASLLVLVLGWNGTIGRGDGILLFAGLIVYLIWLIRKGRQESRDVEQEYAREFGPEPSRPGAGRLLLQVGGMIVGMALLVLGSRWLIDASITMAQALGVDELIIGLTIVAAGTSLPEVATSVIAGLKGERDIAVGNVVGSNLFNILSVLGLSAIFAPEGVAVPSSALRFDIPVMIAVSVACLPIFFTGHRISRWEGALFLAYYAAYTVNLVLAAKGHEQLYNFQVMMAGFVIPLTAITLVVIAARQWHGTRRASAANGLDRS